MAIRVLTDSTAYLPAEYLERYGIKVVPLQVTIAGEVFKEGQGYSNRQYYARLREEKVFPTTSQPSAGDFVQAIESHPETDTIVGIFISSRLSGTVLSAQVARDMLPGRTVVVLDSLSTGMGLGYQVLKACEVAEAGGSLDDVLAAVAEVRERIRLMFVVDDLEYLVRGGRLSKAGQLLGNVLQIKPVLCVENGEIKVYDKVRTKHKALDTIVEEFVRRHREQAVQRVAVVHVDALAEAERLRERVQAVFPGAVDMSELGPVIGSHVGPGALGLIYY
jgi:DegV family protein with EDD domain